MSDGLSEAFRGTYFKNKYSSPSIKKNRIIICGPTAAGKTFLRNKLENKGFKFDVSYTSREPRFNEINKVHYNFVSKQYFEDGINNNLFYEHVEYNGNYYGTGLEEWNTCDCFIMETDGIKHIKKEDRNNCFIIYVNPDESIRKQRMKQERNWSDEQIEKRINTDKIKFKDFIDYDIVIKNNDF